jgi:hypothetical protein
VSPGPSLLPSDAPGRKPGKPGIWNARGAAASTVSAKTGLAQAVRERATANTAVPARAHSLCFKLPPCNANSFENPNVDLRQETGGCHRKHTSSAPDRCAVAPSTAMPRESSRAVNHETTLRDYNDTFTQGPWSACQVVAGSHSCRTGARACTWMARPTAASQGALTCDKATQNATRLSFKTLAGARRAVCMAGNTRSGAIPGGLDALLPFEFSRRPASSGAHETIKSEAINSPKYGSPSAVFV